MSEVAAITADDVRAAVEILKKQEINIQNVWVDESTVLALRGYRLKRQGRKLKLVEDKRFKFPRVHR